MGEKRLSSMNRFAAIVKGAASVSGVSAIAGALDAETGEGENARMKLLLVRHGRMAGDPFCEPGSPVTGCLHPEGVAQAEALGRFLASVPLDAAFTSPYGRAVETAERALAGRGIEVVRVPGLQEWTPSPEYRNATSTEAATASS